MTVEFWLAVLAIVTSVAAGLAYMGKRRSDVALLAAQTEMEEVRGEQSRFDQLMTLINGQVTVNQSFSAALHNMEIQRQKDAEYHAQRREQDYQTLKQVWDRQAWEIMENSRKTGDRMMSELDKLPEKMAMVTVEGLKQVTAELAVQMAEIVRQSVARLEGSVFPALRDRRWVEAYVHPRNGVACLFDEPRFQELAKNLTPDACLRGEERMWIIQEAQPGFHAVRRANGTYGFLLMAAVIVVEMGDHLPKEKAHLEVQDGEASSDNDSSAGSAAGGADVPRAGAGSSRSTARGDKPA